MDGTTVTHVGSIGSLPTRAVPKAGGAGNSNSSSNQTGDQSFARPSERCAGSAVAPGAGPELLRSVD